MKIRKRRSKKLHGFSLVLIIALAGTYSYWTVNRPLPSLQPTHRSLLLQVQTPASKLAWPNEQSAVGIVGSPILESHNAQTPAPTASIAKLITALSVLHNKPLAPGQQGPTITLSAADVALYNSYAAEGGSVVPVTAGEQISEYQVLETMLLPSANNMADSLAIWAFGSLNAYARFANGYILQLGLAQTHVGSDASGFDPSTTSTATDLVKLGEIVMENPVLAGIVGQATVSNIPVAGTIKNVNFLLGSNGIVGIKTGNSDQAKGVFISAANVTVNNKPTTIVTTLLGAPTLFDALQSSLPLVQSVEANFQALPIITKGSVVGNYQLPWGGTIPAIASQSLRIDEWDGSIIPITVKLQSLSANSHAGQSIGSLSISASSLASQHSVNVTLKTIPPKPSFWWRLLHP